MCDDIIEADSRAYLEKLRLNRRELLSTGAAFATLLTGCDSPTAPTPQPVTTPKVTSGAAPGTESASSAVPPALSSSTVTVNAAPASTVLEAALASFPNTTGRMVTIETKDGQADAFFVTPKEGKHPGVIMWPDIAGLREAFMTMGARLASEGYAVLVVNQYYRSSKFPILGTFAEWRTEAGKAKIAPMKDAIPLEGIARDGVAYIQWLDQQPEVDTKKKIGCAGYCMTGSYTIRTAAAAPSKRVGVAASFHGGGLVTSEPTSPHLLLFKTKKLCLLICIAQNDDVKEPEVKKTLRRAAESAKLAAEIEVYPAAHGFCSLDSPVYDGPQAEKAWERFLDRLGRYL